MKFASEVKINFHYALFKLKKLVKDEASFMLIELILFSVTLTQNEYIKILHFYVEEFFLNA